MERDGTSLHGGFGWPDFLTTKWAARYCGLKDSASIRRARLRGDLRAEGKRGGTGPWVFARSELDRWMTMHPDKERYQ